MSTKLVLHQAFVRLTRAKGVFGLVVVALGIALGSVVCAVAFAHLVTSQPLPYPEQERLAVAQQIIVDSADNTHSRDFSYPALALLHREAQGVVFAAAVMIDRARDIVVSHPAQPLVNVTYASREYAGLFAPPMAKGGFPGSHSGERAIPVAVISHSAWQTLFGMREDVLGKTVRTAAGVDFEVVGVTARDFVEPEFHGPGNRTDVWLPWDFNPSPRHWGWAATTATLAFVGRLEAGISEQQAAARLTQLLNPRWQEELGASSPPGAGRVTRVELVSAHRTIAGDGLEVGPLLLAGTLGLILVTLVNVTHLLVARIAERAREFAIQLALGASRVRLFGLVLADMLLVMLPAGVVALITAAVGFLLMQHHLGNMLPRLAELSVGWRAASITMGSTVALALLLSAIALAATGRLAASGELNAGRNAGETKLSRRLRALLMASQIGVAGLLIAISFGLFRDAYQILAAEGIALDRSASLFLYQTASAPPNGESLEQQFGNTKRQLAALPGVETVSQSHSPLQDFIKTVVISGRSGAQYPVELKRVDHAFLGITGQRLAMGRNFSATDVSQGADVAMVNATFAKVLKREGGVLGTTLSRSGDTLNNVIGVMEDRVYPGSSATNLRVYLPASEAGSNFIIRFRPGEYMSREQIVAFVAGVNPGFGVFLYDDLDRQRAQILLPRRMTAVAALVVAFVVALVSAIGLYGMVRYATRRMCPEIGAQLAFGARPRHIVLTLLRNNFAAIASGCVASAAAALLVLPGLQPWLELRPLNVHWTDAAVSVGALALLAIVACCLSVRPLLLRSPASLLSQAGH